MARLAAILYPPGTDIDALLGSVARPLAAAGARVGGVVQARDAEGCQGMAVVDLRDGHARSIAQNLGPLSTSCKLDTAAMADIAGDLERQIDAGLDLLILSRFGKTEIEGNGFRSLFGRALLSGTPLLTGVRAENAAAWAAFHGGLGTDLPPDEAQVLVWASGAVR
ncbi:DUF2478 domain-containing protein [Pleomorphomonas carboxyditropha]|uniref:Molybdenum ABC transporter ATP-binding protein n=1 Tax=Pleomorphomonas carboxyditropha TaxID=2023338 RepID=A0A2G9WP45_9HYPH|nr:DUF2478 domain-containing protein [Pleomorphomonas carboxyditropha]PIO96443.1 hypothetical protein CJ014_25375 [Pleomorphomonas carboxyditropha]